jgi:histidyl-tRNA synthetase
VILGAKELETGHVAVKDLRTGDQLDVRREEVAAWLSTRKDAVAP